MNRLKIVVEQDGADFKVCYVGKDSAKAQAALKAETSNDRAFFNYPAPTQYNRPAAKVKTDAGNAQEVVEEPKQESPKSKKSK